MRNVSLVLGCVVLATTAWGVRGPRPPKTGAALGPVATARAATLPSYVQAELLPGPLVPALPMFLVVSPVPATLAEGTPPT